MNESEALAVSSVIEALVAFVMLRFNRWPCRGAGHVSLASAVATAVTHPQLWEAVYWAAPRFGYWPSVVGLEVIVVIVEGLLISWMAALSRPQSMLVSLAANLSSATLGLLFLS